MQPPNNSTERYKLVGHPGRTEKQPIIGATYMNQHILARHAHHSAVEFELVPEPNNALDQWAVATHIDGERVGYLESIDAQAMHDFITGHNRQGRTVIADGTVQMVDKGTLRATVNLPWWEDQAQFRAESGVLEDCEAILRMLPEETIERATRKATTLDPYDVALLKSFSYLAPYLVWPHEDPLDIPEALRIAIGHLDLARKERAREEAKRQQAERKAQRDAQKNAQREAKHMQRDQRDAQIKDLVSRGRTIMEIMGELRISDTTVRAVAREAGLRLADANSAQRDPYVAQGKQALKLQDQGISKAQVAKELGCSPAELETLLDDARFLADPASNPTRYQRAVKVQTADHFKSLKAAAQALGWPVNVTRDARRDASDMQRHTPRITG